MKTRKQIIRIAISLLVATQTTGVQASIVSAKAANSRQDVVIATIGHKAIYKSDFEHYLQGSSSPDELAAMKTNRTARIAALYDYLDLRVLAAKAQGEGIDRSPIFQKACELMEMKILDSIVTERDRGRFTQAAAVSDRELKAYYDHHPEQFQMPAGFTAWQIVVFVKGNSAFPDRGVDATSARARAQSLLKRLRGGESWEKVVRSLSGDSAKSAEGGLIKQAQFGYYPPDMEAAVRQQAVGRPDIFQSSVGFNLLQVTQRSLNGGRASFASVKEAIRSEVAEGKIEVAHDAYLAPLRAQLKLKETVLAAQPDFRQDWDTPNGDSNVLATLNGAPLYESDFKWFVKDAYRAEQRYQALSRPGARRSMLTSYLTMRVLQAKAHRDGLDKAPGFLASRDAARTKLLAEFLQERDRTSPWMLPGKTEEARAGALKTYLNHLRHDVGFKIASLPKSDR